MAQILIAEPSDIVAMTARRILENMGHRTERSTDPQAARAMVRSGDFDLLLAAGDLGSESGLALSRALREEEGFEGETVLMLVGDEDETAMPGTQDEIAGIVEKPFDKTALDVALSLATSTDGARG